MSFLKTKRKISKQTDTVTEKFKQGLEKRNSFADKVNDLVFRYRKVDEDFFRRIRRNFNRCRCWRFDSDGINRPAERRSATP